MSERTSSSRKWWLLVGGFVVFVVAFTVLESLFRPTPSAEGSTPEENATAMRSPAPPRLHRLADGGIEIRHDLFRRTTIRMDNEDEANALYDCLAQGIEKTFGEGAEGWDSGRVRRETQRIQDGCMGSMHGIPVPPPLPGK